MSGDWDVRGMDPETILVGPVNEAIIDADRRVRLRLDNGFPNWAMYRTAYAGDAHLRQRLRDFCVAFAVAYCEAGGVRKGLPADEIGALAGWDAFYALLNHKWVIAGMDIADVAGIAPITYRRVRNHVYSAMHASLRSYWELMQIEFREVIRENRRVEVIASGKWSHGRGFGEVDHAGDGCYRANPLAASGGPGVFSADLKKLGL